MTVKDRDQSGRRSIRAGAILVAIGIWLLINRAGIEGIWFGNSWPLMLVLIGLAMALVPSRTEGRREGIMLMVWGGLFWVAVHGIWGLGWGSIWPLFLVALGIELIWQALFRSRPEQCGTSNWWPAVVVRLGGRDPERDKEESSHE